MKIGSLYHIKKFSWLLFPSQETVVVGAVADTIDAHVSVTTTDKEAEELASHWSKILDCNVSYIAEKSLFMLLEKDNDSCKILTTDGNIGWFAYPKDAEWSKGCIEEVKVE